MSMARPDQRAELKFVVTNTLIVEDIQRSVAFYRDVLAATVLREGEPTFLRLGNIWLTINGEGGGTDDKPEVVASPPRGSPPARNASRLQRKQWASGGAVCGITPGQTYSRLDVGAVQAMAAASRCHTTSPTIASNKRAGASSRSVIGRCCRKKFLGDL